jgi:hypothetical protein
MTLMNVIGSESLPVLAEEREHGVAVPIDLGVIALFPGWRTLSLSEFGRLQGAPFGGMLEVSSNHHASHQEPLYGPYYADKEPVDNHLATFGGATLWLTRPGRSPA